MQSISNNYRLQAVLCPFCSFKIDTSLIVRDQCGLTSVRMSLKAAVFAFQLFMSPGNCPAMYARTVASMSWQHVKLLSSIFSSFCTCCAQRHKRTLETILLFKVALLCACFWAQMGSQAFLMKSWWAEMQGPRDTSTSSQLRMRLSDVDFVFSCKVACFNTHSCMSGGVLSSPAIWASLIKKYAWAATESQRILDILWTSWKASMPLSATISGNLQAQIWGEYKTLKSLTV